VSIRGFDISRRYVVKATRTLFGQKRRKILKYPKISNYCLIMHTSKVPCDSFDENCAHTRTFSNTLFYTRESHFLVHEREEGVTSVFLLFLHIFNVEIINIFKKQLFNMTNHGQIPSRFFPPWTYPLL